MINLYGFWFLTTGLKIFNVLFISFILLQGPGAGPSSGMPPIAANADRQLGNSSCVSFNVLLHAHIVIHYIVKNFFLCNVHLSIYIHLIALA